MNNDYGMLYSGPLWPNFSMSMNNQETRKFQGDGKG